jgi:hypothetical protein
MDASTVRILYKISKCVVEIGQQRWLYILTSKALLIVVSNG